MSGEQLERLAKDRTRVRIEQTVVETSTASFSGLSARFNVARNAHRDELLSVSSRVLTPYRWVSVDGKPDWIGDVSVARAGALSLVHMTHNGSSLLSQIPAVNSYYDLHFAISGSTRIDVPGDSVTVDRSTAAIISPRTPMEMFLGDRYEQFHVLIERAALERELERILGHAVVAPLRFDHRVDLDAAISSNWLRAVGLLIDDLAWMDDDPDARMHLDTWAGFLIARLLAIQPHNYSDEVERRRGARLPVPSRLRRALEIIDSQPDATHPLAEVARAAGVTTRSLQRDFRVYLGITPRAYIEQARLAGARADLVSGNGATVADIAFRWGFGHVSRFAASYRERYGELPSQTLRR